MLLLPTMGGYASKWNFPRSYVTGLATNWLPNSINDISGRDWTIRANPSSTHYRKHIRFSSRFYDWSSNVYSLPFIFDDFELLADDISPTTPEAMTIHLQYHPITGRRYLALDVGFWSSWYYIDLPPSPNDYWLPSI